MSLVEKFELKTDSHEQLVLAIDIVLKWHSRVSHFKSGVDKEGTPFLTLQWHESGGGQPLIAPMVKAEAIADQVYSWLKTLDYKGVTAGYEGGDGTDSQGWHFSIESPIMPAAMGWSQNFYDVFTVYPYWIYYSK